MPEAIQLQIPEPCHENWQTMSPKEQGRFCGSCQKMVVDFSIMSDKEILNYISSANTHLCGRFSNDQLNREIKAAENKRRFSWAYVWNVLLATFLVTESYAQGEPVMKKKPVTTKKPVLPNALPTMGTVAVVEPVNLMLKKDISGVVLNGNNQPLSSVSIFIKGTTIGTASDSAGNFHLQIDNVDSVALVISYVGFVSKTILLNNSTNWQQVKVVMNESYEELSSGVIVVGYKVPKKEKVKRAINSLVPAAFKKDIKIYPNPVVRGNAIQANVSLKQEGSYKLELLDVQGRVVEVQKLELNNKEKQVTIPTQTKWSTGIYWMRITAPGIKNVYQAKVMLQ